MDPAPVPPFEVVETAAGRLYLTRAALGPLDEWALVAFVVTGIGWIRVLLARKPGEKVAVTIVRGGPTKELMLPMQE